MIKRIVQVLVLGMLCGDISLSGAQIPITNEYVAAGLSHYNWTSQDTFIDSSICGASIAVGFHNTQQVSLEVDLNHIATSIPSRFPILAWSVNGGSIQTHQLAPLETAVVLVSGVQDPCIDLFIKGMSPFENRYSGDVPVNSVKITGFRVDEGGVATAFPLPDKVWLNIGDSIMSGDAAAYTEGQGRPPNDLWAASDDGRASYGYLLAQHYGFRESRLAYGGYNWTGGLAGIPALTTLIDQKTSTVSRLMDGLLDPLPDVVLINLGQNGVPASSSVTQALWKIRSRVKTTTKIIVMIPLSGKGKAEISSGFSDYKTNAADRNAYLIDLGEILFATAGGIHPTAAGHQSVFQAVLPKIDAIVADIADSDNDGLPNGWEQFYFGNITNTVSSAMSSNGVNTMLQAYVAGLNPTDTSDFFIISNRWNMLQWNVVSGRVYSIYWSANPMNGFQSLETNIPWTTGSFTDSVHAANNSGYYKMDVGLSP